MENAPQAAPPRTKDFGGPSIHFPMLTSANYTVWAMKMKVTLRVSDVWETIDPGNADSKKNDVAIALLFQSIPESLTLQIGEQTQAKSIWEAIKSRHQGADRVKEARLQTLMAELDKLTMNDSETVDDFSGKISGIAAQSSALGEIIDETKLVKKFLKGLPDKFIQIVASLEQVLDLKHTGFDDIVGRIKAYEERVNHIRPSEDQGKLMFSNSINTRGGYGNSRGGARGRGGSGRGGYGRGNQGSSSSGRGKGRGRSNGQNRG